MTFGLRKGNAAHRSSSTDKDILNLGSPAFYSSQNSSTTSVEKDSSSEFVSSASKDMSQSRDIPSVVYRNSLQNDSKLSPQTIPIPKHSSNHFPLTDGVSEPTNKTDSLMNSDFAVYTLQPPDVKSLANWKKGTFCDNYIGHPIRQPVAMCGGELRPEDSLTCFGNPEKNQMAMCSAKFLAVEPKKLQKSVLDCDACNIDGSGSLHLIKNNVTHCDQPNTDTLHSYAEDNNPVHRSMKEITSNSLVAPETCKTWINKTAYFFHSQRYHIYFRMYSYYNLYQTLLDRGAEPGNYVVLRMAEATGYKFEDFERTLFPELQTLSQLPDERVCFREVVFSPWAYACVMFRCKMSNSTRELCLQCDGHGLSGTTLMTFRTRVLQACSLVDQTPEQRKTRTTKSIVFVKRKPYHRWKEDYSQNFQRILSNQDDLILELKTSFPEVAVHDVYMEDIDICEQMRLVHECDVFIGVHGAGLVHSWWLQDDASVLELVPPSHAGIPSFKTLTKLAGRHYHSIRITGDMYRVTVDIGKTISMVDNISHLK